MTGFRFRPSLESLDERIVPDGAPVGVPEGGSPVANEGAAPTQPRTIDDIQREINTIRTVIDDLHYDFMMTFAVDDCLLYEQEHLDVFDDRDRIADITIELEENRTRRDEITLESNLLTDYKLELQLMIENLRNHSNQDQN